MKLGFPSCLLWITNWIFLFIANPPIWFITAYVLLNVEDSIPFQLHNWYLLGTILVSKVLTKDKYHSWCLSTEVTSKAKNKINFVSVLIAQRINIDPLFAVWERNNSMIIYWILNFKDTEETIIYARIAREMWNEPRTSFVKVMNREIFQLHKELWINFHTNCYRQDIIVKSKKTIKIKKQPTEWEMRRLNAT